MENPKPPLLTITKEDIQGIKSTAFGELHRTWPKGLDEKEIQVLLICQGFISYMRRKGVKFPVKIEYDWERHNRSKG